MTRPYTVRTHGTHGGYVGGCRCDLCKEAHVIQLTLNRIRDNGESNRKRFNNHYHSKISNVRNAALQKLGGICVRCGFSDKRALQFDHINSNGKNDERRKYGNLGYYKWIIKTPEVEKILQILCSNCNWIKRAELEEGGISR